MNWFGRAWMRVLGFPRSLLLDGSDSQNTLVPDSIERAVNVELRLRNMRAEIDELHEAVEQSALRHITLSRRVTLLERDLPDIYTDEDPEA